MTDHEILVWGPNPIGGRTSRGLVLPSGWVWTCTCGAGETGLSSEQSAEDGGSLHEMELAS